jgi:imidazole glycerol-phosphate synthase subunit HisF
MLKVRIIPTLLYKNTELVKGISFDSWRPVGSVIQAIKVYNIREVDELMFFDITATNESRHPDFTLIDDIADDCFMPLTIGGGITTVQDVEQLLKIGADKISICTSAALNTSIIRNIANRFGSQCIVVAIDVKKINSKYHICINSGSKILNKDPIEFSQEVEKMGAGEILLTSVDRDGTMKGYDTDILKQITKRVSIPVIASGGAGTYEHMYMAFSIGNVSAVAAASMYHFTHQTPLEAKKYLHDKGILVRL